MKIALINASPKAKSSVSELLINSLKVNLKNKAELYDVKLRKPTVSADTLATLESCDVWVIAYPLYVDALPSHLLSCLKELEKTEFLSKNKKVYAVANCGLYEGVQTKYSLEILEHWCKKVGFKWCGAVGIGAGPSYSAVSKAGHGKGPAGTVDGALDTLAETMLKGQAKENGYTSVGMPSFIFKLAAQLMWRNHIKQNGGRVKDLYNKPTE